MSKTVEGSYQLRHTNINCRSCLKYQECKSIETKHKTELDELEGNWRALFEDGKRVGTPIRRCSHAIVETHRDKFINKSALEIGCGPLSEIDYEFCKNNSVEYVGIDSDRLPTDLTFSHRPGTKIKKAVFTLFYYLKRNKFQRLNKFQQYLLESFPSQRLIDPGFDLVYGNSTIEHWHEDVEDIESSLNLYKKDIDYI